MEKMIWVENFSVNQGAFVKTEIVSMVLITTTIGVISTMIRHINRRKPARCSPGIRHAITALG